MFSIAELFVYIYRASKKAFKTTISDVRSLNLFRPYTGSFFISEAFQKFLQLLKAYIKNVRFFTAFQTSLHCPIFYYIWSFSENFTLLQRQLLKASRKYVRFLAFQTPYHLPAFFLSVSFSENFTELPRKLLKQPYQTLLFYSFSCPLHLSAFFLSVICSFSKKITNFTKKTLLGTSMNLTPLTKSLLRCNEQQTDYKLIKQESGIVIYPHISV